MRKLFEVQLKAGQIPIEKVIIPVKSRYALDELCAALQAIYCDKDYNERIFSILDKYINKDKKKTGRPGMNLWSIFVLSQVRLCLNIGYEELHNLVNNHRCLRQIIGIHVEYGFDTETYGYQRIYDNVSQLNETMLKEINEVILSFGQNEVFKKKGGTALRLKTDSYVIESNVHFPTDYGLLWDCIRKSIDSMLYFTERYKNIPGWRKIKCWQSSLKSLSREVGRANASGGKNKKEKLEKVTKQYLSISRELHEKLKSTLPFLPVEGIKNGIVRMELEYYMQLLEKHIDLVHRRIIKGEKIPHEEKMFSIFETYTEWLTKGKLSPNVELGKKLNLTTDQNGLIIDYQIMNHEADKSSVLKLADRVLAKIKDRAIASWSFDKGYYSKDNKELLKTEIEQVIMPKVGKRNKTEEEEEHGKTFIKFRNKHSGIESNINELEHRGLDRCPDRGYSHFKRYIGTGVCAYNLKKIGRELLEQNREKLKKELALKKTA
jgi:hypothetical protein